MHSKFAFTFRKFHLSQTELIVTRITKKKQLKTFSTNLSLPFPMGAASPFRSCDSDLFGEPGDSHKVKGSVLRISNFPAWSRNFSSSFDRRLNCSL